MRRLQAAEEAMRPEIERMKAEMEQEWMEGPLSAGGLALLIGEPE